MTLHFLHRTILAFAPLTLIAACAGPGTAANGKADALFGVFEPYRADVVQGNVVTQEVASQIQPGLGRMQVRDILGTPLLVDPFHANRWDYVFHHQAPGRT